MKYLRATSTLLIFLVLALTCQAQFPISGQVVDNLGAPLSGATIEVAVEGTIVTTDLGGNFSFSVDPGTYAIQVSPPAFLPLAPKIISHITLSGPVSLGQISLDPGVILSGTVTDSNAVPVAFGDLDIFDDDTGIKFVTPGGKTNILGTFAIRVPAGTLRLRAEPVPGQLLVSEIQTLSVTANLNVGTIILSPGVLLSGMVIDSATLLPLKNVDLDVDDSATGQRIQTPGDNTDAAGLFAIIVPTGVFDISFEPKRGAQILVGKQLKNIAITGSLNLGTVTMDPGLEISGQLVDPNGFPISAGDIDVRTQVGDTLLYTPGDNTEPDGSFLVVVPVGTHRFIFNPDNSTSLLAQSTAFTAFSTDTDLGTIPLAAGFHLTGVIVNATTSAPLAGVDIDVDDLATGLRINTPGDKTDATGAFDVVVPPSVHFVSFEPLRGIQIVVGQKIPVLVASMATDMGTIGLEPGVAITGTVVDSLGQPVVNADIDVRALAGDTTVFTPGDQTLTDGSFLIVAPTGTHRVVIQPLTADLLVATSTPFTLFGTSTDLGTQVMQSGHLLSGTVTALGGAPQSDCKIVVSNSTTGTPIQLTDNTTDANGSYGVVVPAGTVSVAFRTRKASLARDTEFPNVVITGPTTLDAPLAILPMLIYVDDPAFPGPQIVPSGAPQLFVTVALFNPNGFTTGTFLTAEIEDPFGGITPLLVDSPTILGATQFLLFQFLPIPLPIPGPGHAGLPHKFRITLADPLDGSEIDVDEFTYFPQ